MGLQAQLPLRVGQAVLHGETGILLALRPVHRLKQPAGEIEFLEQLWGCLLLREDEFEFVAAGEFQWCARLWADANPIQPRGSILGAIGLDSYLEPSLMEGLDGGLVKLQEWFATGADNERARKPVVRTMPRGSHRRSQFLSGGKSSATWTVRAYEVGVAELADCASAVFLPASPQVATGESTEHRGPSGMRTLTLEGVKDFFD